MPNRQAKVDRKTSPGATLVELEGALARLANPNIAEHSQAFFKTGPGQYGAGDVFIGIRVPELRKLAKAYCHLNSPDIRQLIQSPIHERRLLATLVLVLQFERGDAAQRKRLHAFYLQHLRRINNWDLVDSSAPTLVGAFLADKSRTLLDELAQSQTLWERRIAIIATLHFIRGDQFEDTLRIGRLLLGDSEDLIHKAVGWMLREVAKRDQPAAEQFLRRHHRKMPRTMLRYAIERFPEPLRKAYLQGTV